MVAVPCHCTPSGLRRRVCLPPWLRFLPAAATASAAVLAVGGGISLSASAAGDTAGRVGAYLLLAGCAYAFAGALWRLGSRRRQRALALAAGTAVPGRGFTAGRPPDGCTRGRNPSCAWACAPATRSTCGCTRTPAPPTRRP
ncbi:hypothetical protein ACFXB3_27525 [Streptomyces sp. NPDC059447]|uniref:hypothetical protein n=1 Tax=Streptomyces sp. NPDC059447 TaxID=3346834 RepID=UPI0036975265